MSTPRESRQFGDVAGEGYFSKTPQVAMGFVLNNMIFYPGKFVLCFCFQKFKPINFVVYVMLFDLYNEAVGHYQRYQCLFKSTIFINVALPAHFTQFMAPGWHYLLHGHGVGRLANNGSYVSLASPDGKDLTIVLETMVSHIYGQRSNHCSRNYGKP